jgi:hypothetical protein
MNGELTNDRSGEMITQRLVRAAISVGPALLTIAVVLAARAHPPGPWIVDALLYGLPTLIVWHAILLFRHRDNAEYLVYAVFNLFFYFVLLISRPGVIDL